MQCDEKKEICLNYAANVPEWKLSLILDALAKLGDASRCCGTVQKAVAGGQSYMRLHPDSEYAGEHVPEAWMQGGGVQTWTK